MGCGNFGAEADLRAEAPASGAEGSEAVVSLLVVWSEAVQFEKCRGEADLPATGAAESKDLETLKRFLEK